MQVLFFILINIDCKGGSSAKALLAIWRFQKPQSIFLNVTIALDIAFIQGSYLSLDVNI